MANGFRVLIVTPSYLPDITGNAVTAHRLYKGLRDRGIEVQVQCRGGVTPPLQFRPDIIHALHALKGGVPAMEMAERLDVPFVVTITGTDLNIDLLQSENLEILKVLDKAARIVTYSPLSKERLSSRLPVVSRKITVIGPSVEIARQKGGISSLPSGFNFLLPSGIRKVKGPAFAIRPLEALRSEFPSIKLTIVGPLIDDAEWKNLSDAMGGKEWISYMKVTHEEMPDIYDSAAVVLNTSVSEGLSNAILEAMSLGKAVLASDCEGNRAVISDGLDGILYKQGDEADFLRKAKRLVLDLEFRERLGRAAREKVAIEFSRDAEIDGHLRLYGEVLEHERKRGAIF
ncbi:MAG: glycosyltransferase [Deltaproteobacteria bacterium]|nr:glycosyltransferase [Deltaproteobacteria bacterium]